MKQMKALTIISIFIVLLATSAVLGCTSSSTTTPAPTTAPTATPTTTPTTAPSTEYATLTVKGNVSTPLTLSPADLKAIGTTHVNLTLNAHGTISYIDCDAVSLNALLNKAGVLSGAKSVTFTGTDAFSATVPLANITSDSSTVIAFTANGQGLRDCLPKEAAKYWVQNLTAITVS